MTEITSIEQLLEFFEKTVFYPYAFKEMLLEYEERLLKRIKELEDEVQRLSD
jgi:hypothetical protein